MSIISSKRLDLISMTPSFLRASLEQNVRQAERILGFALPEGWPEHTDVLSLRLRQLEADATLQPWLLRGIVLRSDAVVVGHIGFHTAPGAPYLRQYSPAGVEFGFTIFPQYRRRGYAREASVALMRWAHEVHGVTSFVLSIRPDNKESQSLARSLGFTRIGSHLDEVDGWEDVLEYQQVQTSPTS